MFMERHIISINKQHSAKKLFLFNRFVNYQFINNMKHALKCYVKCTYTNVVLPFIVRQFIKIQNHKKYI